MKMRIMKNKLPWDADYRIAKNEKNEKNNKNEKMKIIALMYCKNEK